MMLQINCKLKYAGVVETYSDLANKAFGYKGKLAVDFCLYTSQIGCCIAYLLFVGKQVDQVVCQLSSAYCGNKKDYILLSALVLIPVCCMRTFRFIGYLSGFANLSIVVACKIIYQFLSFKVSVIVYDSVGNA